MADNKSTKEERDRIRATALNEPANPEPPKEPEDQKPVGEKGQEPVNPEPPKEPAKEPPKEPESKLPNVETRYQESTREAQVLFAKQKKFIESVDKAKTLPEPTEAELRSEYPEWDEMTDTEKKLARKNVINERKFGLVEEAATEGRDIQDWSDKVESFITTTLPANKELSGKLAGREDDFRSFCMKPTRRGIDPEDLAKLFLYDTPAKHNKGSLLESGSGGEPTKPKSEYIGAEEAARLRKTDHKKYNEYVRTGKIRIQL